MKNLIFILFLFIGTIGFCQEFSPATKAVTEASLIKNSTNTGKLYNSNVVYLSKNGKYFVIKKSKNGNFYKYYLTIKS